MENYYTALDKLLRQVFIATEVLFVYLWTPQKKFPPLPSEKSCMNPCTVWSDLVI